MRYLTIILFYILSLYAYSQSDSVSIKNNDNYIIISDLIRNGLKNNYDQIYSLSNRLNVIEKDVLYNRHKKLVFRAVATNFIPLLPIGSIMQEDYAGAAGIVMVQTLFIAISQSMSSRSNGSFLPNDGQSIMILSAMGMPMIWAGYYGSSFNKKLKNSLKLDSKNDVTYNLNPRFFLTSNNKIITGIELSLKF